MMSKTVMPSAIPITEYWKRIVGEPAIAAIPSNIKGELNCPMKIELDTIAITRSLCRGLTRLSALTLINREQNPLAKTNYACTS